MSEKTIKEQVAAAAAALEDQREFAAEEAGWNDNVLDSVLATSRAYLSEHKGLSTSRELVKEAQMSVELRKTLAKFNLYKGWVKRLGSFEKMKKHLLANDSTFQEYTRNLEAARAELQVAEADGLQLEKVSWDHPLNVKIREYQKIRDGAVNRAVSRVHELCDEVRAEAEASGAIEFRVANSNGFAQKLISNKESK